MTLRWEMLVLRKMVEVRTGFDRNPGGGWVTQTTPAVEFDETLDSNI